LASKPRRNCWCDKDKGSSRDQGIGEDVAPSPIDAENAQTDCACLACRRSRDLLRILRAARNGLGCSGLAYRPVGRT
jgi:hypothetical protein